MLSLFWKRTAKCLSLPGLKKKKSAWQVPMAPLPSSEVSSGKRQEGWHRTYFLQAFYFRGTCLLRSFSILPNDVIPNCHLVYLEHTALQINMLFNRGSRQRVILLAKCLRYIKWHWLRDGDEERSELSAIGVERARAGEGRNCAVVSVCFKKL